MKQNAAQARFFRRKNAPLAKLMRHNSTQVIFFDWILMSSRSSWCSMYISIHKSQVESDSFNHWNKFMKLIDRINFLTLNGPHRTHTQRSPKARSPTACIHIQRDHKPTTHKWMYYLHTSIEIPFEILSKDYLHWRSFLIFLLLFQ